MKSRCSANTRPSSQVSALISRLLLEPNTHSLVLLSHAAARAGQHRRLPLAPRLAAAVAPLLAACDGAQLGMLSVAFAELWPSDGTAQRDFWVMLGDKASAAALQASAGAPRALK